jgi:hypothetical protein
METLAIGSWWAIITCTDYFYPYFNFFLAFETQKLVTLISMFGAPTAVSSYTMAQQMGADDELAGNWSSLRQYSRFSRCFCGSSWEKHGTYYKVDSYFAFNKFQIQKYLDKKPYP